MEQLYTVKEVLDMLRISRATLYRHIEAGMITPVKLGRRVLFTEGEMNSILQRMKEGVQGDKAAE